MEIDRSLLWRKEYLDEDGWPWDGLDRVGVLVQIV
jgi:hypothetical protein